MSELKFDKDSWVCFVGQIWCYFDEEFEIEIGNMDVEVLIDYLLIMFGVNFL